ncbi:perforin-1-like [Chanos chanos]|uniref:Perforin-1-like n=1 Tax=Chanos chanos TaxID=29144 RepID=A0A6J2WNQ5_CHACN|nr:perforin-1-like [Chanos chanos]
MRCFERIMKNYICFSLPCILDPLQFTYRPNHPIDDAVSHVLHTALSSLDISWGNYVRMLFIDYSSAFNTIVSPLLVNDTVVVGLITNKNKRANLEEVEDLMKWCQANCLSLNVSKTKDLVVGFCRTRQRSYTPFSSNGAPVETKYHTYTPIRLSYSNTIETAQKMLAKWFCFTFWWACHLQFSQVISEKQKLGTPEECKNAGFIPGYNLAGEGFDIVKMERKGSFVIDTRKWNKQDGNCILIINRFMNKVKQKLPVAVVDWRARSQCSMKVASRLYESSESLVNDSTSSVSDSWKAGLDIPNVAGQSYGGTHSREARFAMKKSKEDKYSFTKHEVTCSFYSFRVINKPPLHQQFVQAVTTLPKSDNVKAYQELIDTFGTHYISKVTLGGMMKAITSIRTCKATMSGLTDTAVKDCLEVEASATYKSATLSSELQHCEALKRKMGLRRGFSSEFRERQTKVMGGNINGEHLLFSGKLHPNALKTWVESLKTIPDVITYSLKPLHFLLDKKHPARDRLKRAVEKYIKDYALKNVCSAKCRIGRQCNPRDRCACVCNRSRNIHSNCCPAGRGLATLRVYGLRAKGLYGDVTTQTDGSVKVSYGSIIKRTEVINNNDNPRWPESFEFGPIQVSMGTNLKFEVYDADSYWNSDFLGTCSVSLRSGTVSDSCYFKYGAFFFSYTVQCAPSLQGPQCNEYSPSPMESSLAKIFHSRNGILAKDLWKLELGRNYTDELRMKSFKEKEFSHM